MLREGFRMEVVDMTEEVWGIFNAARGVEDC
jgi:hypothetical protein